MDAKLCEVHVVVGQQHAQRGLALARQAGRRTGRRLGGRGVHRQGELEADAARAGRTPSPQAAAMHGRQLRGQGHAQAERGAVHVLERTRRLVEIGRGGHRDRQRGGVGPGRARRDADRAAALDVAHDVGDQVAERLADPLGIAPHAWQRAGSGLDVEGQLLRVQRGRQVPGDVLQHRRDVERAALQRRLRAGQARQVRQVVGDAHQVAHLALHDAARAQPAGRIVVGQAQQLEAVGQRRERIAQVVCQAGQEGVALAVCGLRVADGGVALGPQRGERGLGVGQRAACAIQFIGHRGHPVGLLTGLGDRGDIALALVPQFRDQRRRQAHPRREDDDEAREGHADQDEQRDDGTLRQEPGRSPDCTAPGHAVRRGPLRTACGAGGARRPRS